jgi:hypothetical protein
MRRARFALQVTVATGVALVALAVSCGSSTTSKFGPGSGGSGGTAGAGGSLCLTGSCAGSGGNGGSGAAGGSGAGGDGGVAACSGCKPDPCLAQGMPPTTITGKVYNPGGTLPLYGVYVYVPNTMPDPIDPGNPACTPCEAPASGDPIVGTLTDETGSFTLQAGTGNPYGVPSGMDIPLVLQTGKWRKQITLSSVTACGTTQAAPGDATATGTNKLLRLPANSTEGDMPLIAFTSGCDPAECFLLNTVGISQSEFVAPTAPLPVAWSATTPPVAGAGHVRFFTGNNEMAGGRGGPGGNPGAGSAIAPGVTAAQTYTWWTSAANLELYDIIFNACECSPYARGNAAYGAMDSFLNMGGRLFTTHYYYNWFTPNPPASADLATVANWDIPTGNTIPDFPTETDAIDQTFPKGAAFATWLQDNGVTTTMGSITLADTRQDVAGLEPAGCSETTGTCRSTQWIYNPTNNDPRYISFNTPVASPVAQQCGKAVFSDVHLSGTSNNAQFPAECTNPNIDTPPGHKINEEALMFLFFDLSSCVQSSGMNAVPPPSKQPAPQ